jgi:hypothetical protein
MVVTNGLIGKFVTEIANMEAVGNDRALTKDDIIKKGAHAFPNRVSNPGKRFKILLVPNEISDVSKGVSGLDVPD